MSARTVTRAVHLTDDHERELLAAGWRFDGRVWWSPENTAHLPLSAWRALCVEIRHSGYVVIKLRADKSQEVCS